MLSVGSVVIRVSDLAEQERFWSAALDYVPNEASRDFDFIILTPRNGDGPSVSLDAHHSEATVPPRIHLDLYSEDQMGDVERLIVLGATRVEWDRQPDDADYVIMADPEGTRFCVVDVTA